MPSRVSSEWPSWLLPLFFAAHVVVTAILIPRLGVRDPLYRAIPLVFGVALLLTLLPPLGRRLRSGSAPWRIAPVLVYAGVITLASSVVPYPAPSLSTNGFHAVEYAGLALLAQLMAHRDPAAPLRLWRLGAVALGCVGFGALDELHQHFVPGRIASLGDLGLDALGVLLGTALFSTLRWQLRSWRSRAGGS